jgi:hypothetical protein
VASYPVTGAATVISLAHLPPATYLVKVGGNAVKVVKQ